jgi:hypothetical protein
MRVVEVLWLDAHVSTGSTTVRKAEKIKPIKTLTVGYLIANTDDGLTLITDRYPDSPKEGKVVNHIPWGMIEEWYQYEIVS